MLRIFVIVCLWVLASMPAAGEWSVFQPLTHPAPPAVDTDEWAGPIDAFVYGRLRDAGLAPAPAVSRASWLRRVAYDLTGLPPAPEDVQKFLADPRTDAAAMNDVVDQLLASPRYGERWGRHWLDVVRYADSDGFAIDAERPSLWRYRDFVIRAFNEDQPFDQFIRQQIAGDELDGGDSGRIAVSFYRLGPWEADNMVKENRRQDYLNDVTSGVGSAFLGLTIGCARCHDHKFDPVLQSDFYQLQAFFTPMQHATIPAGFLPAEMTPEFQRRRDETAARQAEKLTAVRTALKQKIADARSVPLSQVTDAELDQAIQDKKPPLTTADLERLDELKSVDNLYPEKRYEPNVVAIQNPEGTEKPPETFVLANGDVFSPEDKVKPGFLSTVPVWSEELVARAAESDGATSGRRKLLAEWLTSAQNPITPRVLANRIWHYHFGEGLVATPNDFGANGSGVSHPELLDYMAQRLIAGEWRLKPLHKELVLSRTYRMSTHHPEAKRCADIDPGNRLLWRGRPRRLEAEAIRDAVLDVSGQLHLEMGGPGYYDELPDGMSKSYFRFHWEADPKTQTRRRSVYMFVRRNLVYPLLETFDAADPNQSCERRGKAVTAPQALYLFNSQFAHDNALHLARRLQAEADGDVARIIRLYWLALSRAPTADDVQGCLNFVNARRNTYIPADAAGSSGLAATVDEERPPEVNLVRRNAELFAWRDLCLAILNTNEFVYVD